MLVCKHTSTDWLTELCLLSNLRIFICRISRRLRLTWFVSGDIFLSKIPVLFYCNVIFFWSTDVRAKKNILFYTKLKMDVKSGVTTHQVILRISCIFLYLKRFFIEKKIIFPSIFRPFEIKFMWRKLFWFEKFPLWSLIA